MPTTRTSPAHTPGPWTVWVTPGETLFIKSRQFPIAALCHNCTPEETASNARLIAAAPSMKQKLQELVDLADYVSANWEKGNLATAVRNLNRVAAEAQELLAGTSLLLDD